MRDQALAFSHGWGPQDLRPLGAARSFQSGAGSVAVTQQGPAQLAKEPEAANSSGSGRSSVFARLTGVASAIGLIFSALTIYYTGRAFNLQATQQRQATDLQTSAQAAKLNIWLAGEFDTKVQAVIENTASLPVYHLTIYVYVEVDRTDEDSSYFSIAPYTAQTIAPCSRLTVDLSAYTKSALDPTHDTAIVRAEYGMVANFWDSAGISWYRDTGSIQVNKGAGPTPRLVRANTTSPSPDGPLGPQRWPSGTASYRRVDGVGRGNPPPEIAQITTAALCSAP